MSSMDDIPVDGIPLDEIERIQEEYKVDQKQARALAWILKNVPIEGFSALINEELWLREVYKDIAEGKGQARTAALKMLGEWLGTLGKKSGKQGRPASVEFEEL